MYSANGDFINNQSIIENFKNNKKNKKKKSEPGKIKFKIIGLQDGLTYPLTVTYEISINNVLDSIDVFEESGYDFNKIIEVNISFNINNNSKFRTFVVKTNKEAEVNFDYQYSRNNINYQEKEKIINYQEKKNITTSGIKRFNYLIMIPFLSSNNYKCNITIKPHSDSNVIMINDLKTAIEDIIV
jgi:hypothetical protein